MYFDCTYIPRSPLPANFFHYRRSTVAFAREVAETKAMDDALNRLEGMFSGSEPKEDAMAAPKRGDSSVKSGGSFSNSPVPTRAKTEVRVGDVVVLCR